MNRDSLDYNALELKAMDVFIKALEQPNSDREQTIRAECAGDQRLTERALALLRAERDNANLLRTGGAAAEDVDSEPPELVGAYRIIRLIGRGGMGAVYEAHRESNDFEHTVAIKIIRTGALSNLLVERFLNERQILASLSHPNIARLFDGGRTEDGAPYIVMEYVDGTPVDKWAAELKLSKAGRLSLFVDLCLAVRYAHQNLVVHRDITPSNVLVTSEGGVKLIDFGIAKPIDRIDATSSRSVEASDERCYTPGYAAPEREFSDISNTLTDVYSLGKLLETLIPASDMDDELRAVIACAAAHEPEGRYPAVDALLEDLTAYQTGYPVAARMGGAGYRFKKYLRRHWVAVSLGAAAFLTLAGGLAATTYLYQRAESNRIAADQRFEDVRSLATFMMFELYDELEKTSGNTKSISLLADKAQNYLDSLSADPRASLDVALEAGLGYRRLADILGNPKNSNLGRRSEAGALLERALAQIEALHADNRDHPGVLRALGETAFSLSVHTYVSSSDNSRTYALALQAVESYAPLISDENARFSDRKEYVRAVMMSGVVLPWLGRYEEGVATLKDALHRAELLVASYPDRTEARQLLGSINVELARALVRYRDYASNEAAATSPVIEDSLRYWDEAIRLRHEIHAEAPDDIRPYRSLVALYHERGSIRRDYDLYDLAYEDALRAETIARELLAKDPDDSWLNRRLSGILEEKVRTLSYAGRHDEAVSQATAALEIAEFEYAARPEDAGMIREWGFTLVLFADVYLRASKQVEGCRLTNKARDIWDQVAARGELSDHDRSISIANLNKLETACGN